MACQMPTLQVASLGESLSPNTPWVNTKKYWRTIIIEEKSRRTRPYAYIFRATEQEKNLIDGKLKQSGLTMTDFIIRSITDKPIIVVGNSGELLAELKRQGNNLNQAMKNNYFGDLTEQELLSAVDDCKSVYRKLSNAIGAS